MKIAGIGLNSRARAEDIVAAVEAAMRAAGAVEALASLDAKIDARLTAAARSLGLPLRPVSAEALRRAGPAVKTQSSRLLPITGGASLAEAAALAAAGPVARLLLPRQVHGDVTVAIAKEMACERVP